MVCGVCNIYFIRGAIPSYTRSLFISLLDPNIFLPITRTSLRFYCYIDNFIAGPKSHRQIKDTGPSGNNAMRFSYKMMPIEFCFSHYKSNKG